MPKYFELTKEELPKLQEACKSPRGLSDFIDTHYHYTCSCCGKDELYMKSPVLKGDVWRKALQGLGIKEFVPRGISHAYRLPKGYEQEVRFFNVVRTMCKTVPDNKYTMLCRDCVEKGIGRELYKDDLADCLMTRNIIDEFKNRE